MATLDRAIAAELAAPFCFGVAAFTAILASANVLVYLVTLMVRHGLPVGLVAEVLVLRLPETAFYTFPMAALLAAMLAFGRLAGDGELVPWQAMGLAPWRLALPAVALGLAVGALTLALDELVVPAATATARARLFEGVHRQPMPVAREHVFFTDAAAGRSFYARRFDGATMEDVVVQELAGGKLARLVVAAKARPTATGWTFEDGMAHQVEPSGEIRYGARFATLDVPLPADLGAIAREAREPMEMDMRTLGAHAARLAAGGAPARDVAGLWVAWHQKLAVPAAAAVFALLGAALGWRPRGQGTAVGLGVAVLALFAYYLLMFGGMAAGQVGGLPPWLGAWLPNLVALALGGTLLFRAGRPV